MSQTSRVIEEMRVEMARKRMTGSHLAKASGLTPQTISRTLLNQRKRLSLDHLEAITSALGVPAWELIRRAEQNHENGDHS